MLVVVKMTENKMFPIMYSQGNLNALKLSSDDSVLQHKKFGHLNFGELQLLYKANMVLGHPTMQSKDYRCELVSGGQFWRATDT